MAAVHPLLRFPYTYSIYINIGVVNVFLLDIAKSFPYMVRRRLQILQL